MKNSKHVVFWPLAIVGSIVALFGLGACQHQNKPKDYTTELAYAFTNIDHKRFEQAQAQLDSIALLPKPDSVSLNRLHLLQFMLLCKQQKPIENYSHIVQTYDFFASKQAQYPTDFANACFYTAVYYQTKGMDELYIRYLKRTAAYCLKNKHYDIAAKAYHRLGIYYYRKDLYPLALDAYRHAFVLNKQQDNYTWQIRNLKAIGTTHLLQRQTDSALEYYNLAYHLAQSCNDSTIYANLLQNIGVAYREKGDKYTALSYYKKALLWSQQLKNTARTYINIATFYLQFGQTDSVRHYLQLAKPIATTNKDLHLLNNYYHTLSHFYIQQHNTAQALAAFTHFTQYYDSIVQLKNKDIKDKIQLTQVDNKLKNKTVSHYKWHMIYLLLIGGLVATLSLCIWWYYTRLKPRHAIALAKANDNALKYTALLPIYQREINIGKLSLRLLEKEMIDSLHPGYKATKHIEAYIRQLKNKYKEESNHVEQSLLEYLHANGFKIDTAILSPTDLLYVALCHANIDVDDIVFLTRSKSARALQSRNQRIKAKLEAAHIPDNIIEKWIGLCADKIK